MREIPEGILSPVEETPELTVSIEYCDEFDQSYVATTPHKGEPDTRLGVEADLSGAAAKRRLIAMLRRSGYGCAVKVVNGSELDRDPAYYLRHPRPEGTLSHTVERAVDLSASILDELYSDWYNAVDSALLDEGPKQPEFDTSVLAQFYGDHDEGIEIIGRGLHRSPRVLRCLKEGSEPCLGFEPFRIHCDKDQRQLVYDLFDLYWRIDICRRQDLYSGYCF